jgi:hypothetical protein
MMFSPYRKETDPHLIAAANAAYQQGRPEHNTQRSRFARGLNAPAMPPAPAEPLPLNEGGIFRWLYLHTI